MSPRPHAIVPRGLAGLRGFLSSVNTMGPPRGYGAPSVPSPVRAVCPHAVLPQNTGAEGVWLCPIGAAAPGQPGTGERGWGPAGPGPVTTSYGITPGLSLDSGMGLHPFPADTTALFGWTHRPLAWGPPPSQRPPSSQIPLKSLKESSEAPSSQWLNPKPSETARGLMEAGAVGQQNPNLGVPERKNTQHLCTGRR